ncbi:hypothetical protein QCA50_003027 [Cerrena zonata]|uniref:USP domain-containing protein n=1 Tax=Cerrena zonata TaxID=2478898 RepID=A0AAW0GVC8_9APHY
MAHLDTEFQKQSVPGLKSLLADQFQGKQVYGTECSVCHTRSERESEFMEIEVNLPKNSKLEDRIAALLESEELSGDNQYLCSKCDELRDAKRYTEFRQFPPVLHVSLLRFVFDMNTLERKKGTDSQVKIHQADLVLTMVIMSPKYMMSCQSLGISLTMKLLPRSHR